MNPLLRSVNPTPHPTTHARSGNRAAPKQRVGGVPTSSIEACLGTDARRRRFWAGPLESASSMCQVRGGRLGDEVTSQTQAIQSIANIITICTPWATRDPWFVSRRRRAPLLRAVRAKGCMCTWIYTGGRFYIEGVLSHFSFQLFFERRFFWRVRCLVINRQPGLRFESGCKRLVEVAIYSITILPESVTRSSSSSTMVSDAQTAPHAAPAAEADFSKVQCCPA